MNKSVLLAALFAVIGAATTDTSYAKTLAKKDGSIIQKDYSKDTDRKKKKPDSKVVPVKVL